MGYGFEILNDEGGVLLNDRDDFLRLYQEGTVRTSEPIGQGGGGNAGTIDFPTVSKGEPLVITIQPKDRWVTPYDFDLNSAGDIRGFIFMSNVDSVFNYKVFVRYSYGSLPTNDNWGIQLFGGDGRRVYDSGVIEAMYHDTVYIHPMDVSTTQSSNHESKDDAFYAISMFPREYTVWIRSGSNGNLGNWAFKAFRQAGPSTVETGHILFVASPDESAPPRYGGHILVLDDTGF